MESALSIKGQATIPKTIREYLHLQPGDKIKFFVHPDGSVVILPKVRTSVLKGMISPRGRRSPSIGQMDRAVAAGASDAKRRAR